MAKSENWRSRLVNLLLYPDDDTHVRAFEFIKTHWHYVAILHDKDVDDSGNLKKSHYHIIVKFVQARWRSAVADELGITPNYLDKTGSWDASAAYLLHYGTDSKYQYAVDELLGDLAPAVIKLINPLDENARVLDILSLIDGVYDYLPMSMFIRLACENGLWSDVRRMGSFAISVLNEHNERWVLARNEQNKLQAEATRPFGGPHYH